MLDTKNNVLNNSMNISNKSGSFILTATNNWWGTTLAANILSGVDGTANIDYYRLFAAFDLTQGADTDRMPAITSITGILSFGSSFTLTWSPPADTTGFNRYFICGFGKLCKNFITNRF